MTPDQLTEALSLLLAHEDVLAEKTEEELQQAIDAAWGLRQAAFALAVRLEERTLAAFIERAGRAVSTQ